jgi:hypothetical protein
LKGPEYKNITITNSEMKRVDELVISELVIEVESPNSAWAIPGRIQAQIQ